MRAGRILELNLSVFYGKLRPVWAGNLAAKFLQYSVTKIEGDGRAVRPLRRATVRASLPAVRRYQQPVYNSYLFFIIWKFPCDAAAPIYVARVILARDRRYVAPTPYNSVKFVDPITFSDARTGPGQIDLPLIRSLPDQSGARGNYPRRRPKPTPFQTQKNCRLPH